MDDVDCLCVDFLADTENGSGSAAVDESEERHWSLVVQRQVFVGEVYCCVIDSSRKIFVYNKS